jgi:hypothetical protein
MRVDVRSASRQDRIDQLSYLKTVLRQAQHDMVELVASLDNGGDFVETWGAPGAGGGGSVAVSGG